MIKSTCRLNLSTILLISFVILFSSVENFGQRIKYADVAVSGGTLLSVSASYVNNWRLTLGPRDRWEAGLGLRLTSAFGKDVEYITSGPAKYTRSFTTPVIIFFAGQLPENWDTLTVKNVNVNSLNISANVAFNFTEKWGLGFNIDLVGLSFGPSSDGTLESNRVEFQDNVKPAVFNVLLTGDHDIGSLNSEFFLKYNFTEQWGARAVYQFLFTEFETSSAEQTFFDGTKNNRFRNKANNFGLAVYYCF